MLRYALRNALVHKGRLLLSVAAIALGVGVVAGTFVLTDTWRAADAARGNRTHRFDVLVQSAASDGTARSPLAAAVVDQVAQVDEVATATAVVSGVAQLIGSDGQVVGGREPYARSVDSSFADSLRSGRLPQAPDEVVIDTATADGQRFRVGDRLGVVVSGGDLRTYAVVGTVDPGPEFTDVVLVGWAPAVAAAVLAGDGEVSAVEVRAEPGVDEQVLRDRIAAALGGIQEVVTASALAAERAANAAEGFDFLGRIFFIAGVVALFVGTFVIRNTFAIVLASRVRQLALLRCVGASRAQLRRAVLGESTLIGALGSALGLAIGVALAGTLGALLRSEVDIDVAGTGPRVLPRTIMIAFATGVLTATVSAWLPTRRAVRVSPVAALRSASTVDRPVHRWRVAAGSALTLLGVCLVLRGVLSTPVRPAYFSLGAGATVLGVLILGPSLAGLLARLIGAAAARLRGLPARLAAGNAGRSPYRTSATALPLMIGLGLAAVLAIFVASTRASATDTFDHTIRADYRVQALGGQAAINPGVADRLAGLPQLSTMAAFRTADVDVVGAAAGDRAHIVGVDPARLRSVLTLRVTAGNLDDLAPGAIAVSRQTATQRHLTVGAPVTLRAGGRERSFTVRAVYELSDAHGGSLVEDQLPPGLTGFLTTETDLAQLSPEAGLSMIYALARAGMPSHSAHAAVAAALADHPNLDVLSRDQMRQQVLHVIDPAVRVYNSLFALMVLIALLGILNTLALSITERVREIGLLRAIGLDRRQLRSMVRWEAVILAGIGATTGLGLGTFLGWAAGVVTHLPVRIPVGQLAGYTAAGVLITVLAAGLPTQRATRIDILRAIAAQ